MFVPNAVIEQERQKQQEDHRSYAEVYVPDYPVSQPDIPAGIVWHQF